MKQHLVPVGRNDGPGTPWTQSKDIAAWLSYLHEDLGRAILQRDDSADLEPIVRWARTVRDSDVVLTFNYDTLVERSMAELDRCWNHGTRREGDVGVPVFKLHGSIDWLVIDRAEKTNDHTVLFEKQNLNTNGQRTGNVEDDCVLVRQSRDRLCAWMNNSGLELASLSNWPRKSGIAGLGAYKELHTVPGLGVVWAEAMRALREADVAVVIGFSMSDFDALAQMQFAGVAQARDTAGHPLRVIVVDPGINNDEGVEAKKRFGRVFRGVEFRQEAHQDIDWLRFEPEAGTGCVGALMPSCRKP